MGDLWEEGIAAAAAGLTAGGVAARWLFRWARRRCDEALAASRLVPENRSFVFVAKTGPGPLPGARARDLLALQQALDGARSVWSGTEPL